MTTSTVPSMTQKILPVMATANRLLGTVALDVETTFDGSETLVNIKGNVYPVQHTAMRRMPDQAPIHFMCIPMDATQERVGMQNHLPAFASVSTSTPLEGWVSTKTQTQPPRYNNLSVWSKFLHSRPEVPAWVLDVTEVLSQT